MKHFSILLSLISLHCFGETLVLVGSPMAAARSDISCADLAVKKPIEKQLDEICMDSVFELRYEIKTVLAGQYSGREVEFYGFYHYQGLPDFTVYDPALLVLDRHPKGLVLRRVEPVTKRDNRWWLCTKYSESDDECKSGKYVDEYLSHLVKKI